MKKLTTAQELQEFTKTYNENVARIRKECTSTADTLALIAKHEEAVSLSDAIYLEAKITTIRELC